MNETSLLFNISIIKKDVKNECTNILFLAIQRFVILLKYIYVVNKLYVIL